MKTCFHRLISKFKNKFFRQDSNVTSYLNPVDEEFADDSQAALLNKSNPVARMVLYSTLIFLIIGLLWANFTYIEQTAQGEGKVVPSSKVKILQSLDGGIIEKILVKEGDYVKKAQVLMQLDETRYKSEYSAGYAKYLALEGTIARLEAQANDAKIIHFPEDVQKYPDIVKRETRLFEIQTHSLAEEIALLKNVEKSILNQLIMYEELVPKGYASRLDLLKAEQSTNDIRAKIAEKRNNFYETAKSDLTKNRGNLEIIVQQLESLRDKMIRTIIRSPVNGIIKKINKQTIGAVIQPGETLMEIVPQDDTLLIQAKILPADIAFVHIGQEATVKITAYDFSIYGSLSGKVEYISADSLEDEKPSPATSQSPPTYYIVKVRTTKNYLGNDKHKLIIIPGMTAAVHIKTGEKSIMQYLLKPIIKAKEEALRER